MLFRSFNLRQEDGEYLPKTYLQFFEEIKALATSLIKLNLADGKIAIMGQNRYEWCVSYLAVVTIGAIVVPIDKELKEGDVLHILSDSGASAVIFSGQFKSLMLNALENSKSALVLIDMDYASSEKTVLSFNQLVSEGKIACSAGDHTFEAIILNPDALAFLLYTSGTTGNSKAVMLSQKNILSNIIAVGETVKITPADRLLSILPIHHTYECTLGFLLVIASGASISFCQGLKQMLKNLQEVKPTVFIAVPLLLENVHARIMKKVNQAKMGSLKLKAGLLISKSASIFGVNLQKQFFAAIQDIFGGHLRLVITGAAPIKQEVVRDFTNFGIVTLNGYGLTECSPLVLGNNDKFQKLDAAGIPIPGVEVMLDDVDDNGIGEILVKGPNVMMGYYNNAVETANVFTENGWFRTGDLASKDKDGFYFIKGRNKNVIVTSNGKNIYPEEIEAHLYNSPYIKEALVYELNNKENEAEVSATIIPDLDNIKEKFKFSDINTEEIKKVLSDVIKEVNLKMPNYKHIKSFDVRESDFIRTTTQKIKRYLETSKKNDKE